MSLFALTFATKEATIRAAFPVHPAFQANGNMQRAIQTAFEEFKSDFRVGWFRSCPAKIAESRTMEILRLKATQDKRAAKFVVVIGNIVFS